MSGTTTATVTAAVLTGITITPPNSSIAQGTSDTATVMPNGQVVVAGGTGLNPVYLSSVEIFDPARTQWLPAASMANARKSHTATLMPDGRLLVVGGHGVERDAQFDRHRTETGPYHCLLLSIE